MLVVSIIACQLDLQLSRYINALRCGIEGMTCLGDVLHGEASTDFAAVLPRSLIDRTYDSPPRLCEQVADTGVCGSGVWLASGARQHFPLLLRLGEHLGDAQPGPVAVTQAAAASASTCLAMHTGSGETAQLFLENCSGLMNSLGGESCGLSATDAGGSESCCCCSVGIGGNGTLAAVVHARVTLEMSMMEETRA